MSGLLWAWIGGIFPSWMLVLSSVNTLEPSQKPGRLARLIFVVFWPVALLISVVLVVYEERKTQRLSREIQKA